MNLDEIEEEIRILSMHSPCCEACEFVSAFGPFFIKIAKLAKEQNFGVAMLKAIKELEK